MKRKIGDKDNKKEVEFTSYFLISYMHGYFWSVNCEDISKGEGLPNSKAKNTQLYARS